MMTRLAKTRDRARSFGYATVPAETAASIRCHVPDCASCDYLDRLVKPGDSDRFKATVAEARLEHIVERLTTVRGV